MISKCILRSWILMVRLGPGWLGLGGKLIENPLLRCWGNHVSHGRPDDEDLHGNLLSLCTMALEVLPRRSSYGNHGGLRMETGNRMATAWLPCGCLRMVTKEVFVWLPWKSQRRTGNRMVTPPDAGEVLPPNADE